MSSTLKSITALKLAASKTKQTNAIEDALQQLDSTSKLLELSQLSANAFARLRSLLRDRLLPLYIAYPVLALQYSISILTIIHEEKLSAVADEQARGTWVSVQTALLSGILDFVEGHPTSGTRANVATTLYPILRTMFFPSSSRLPSFDGSLFYTLYQLLSETVTKHPVNQRKLRNPEFFGGQQIGIILSHSKDFLAIEALLELFAKLLPSTKSRDGLEKRNTFVDEVFNPAIIAGSKEAVHILKTISTTDWEDTFTRILDVLARANLSFPQPFETSDFQTNGLPPCTVGRLYIDQSGFLANLDQYGLLETLQIMFPIIDGVKLSAPSALRTSVTVRLSSPPYVGQAALARPSEGDISASFNIDNRDVTRFLESLTARGVTKNIIDQTERKLSKAKTHLEFDFQPDNKRTPISTQDKVQDLARLWDCNGSSPRLGEVMPTSPLVLKSPAAQKSSFRHKDALGATDDSDVPADEGDMSRQALPSDVDGTATAPSDDEAGTTTRSRTRATRNNIVLSEDELEKTDRLSIEASKASKAAPRRRQEDTTTAEKSSMGAEVLDSRNSGVVANNELAPTSWGNRFIHEKTDEVCDNGRAESQSAYQAIGPIPSTGTTAHSHSMTKTTTSNLITEIPTTTGRKRVVAKDLLPDTAGSESNHPQKRFRGENHPTTNLIASPRAAKQPPATKRYGRRGRSSSLTHPATDKFDFDELPAASTDFPTINKPNNEKPTARIPAMKGKAGNNTTTEKPATGKRKLKQDRVTVQQAATRTVNNNHALAEPTTKRSPGQKLIGNAESTQIIRQEGQAIKDIKPTRRSARVINIQTDAASIREIASRGKRSASDESVLSGTPVKDTIPQTKSIQQETKPLVDSVELIGPIGVKQLASDSVKDALMTAMKSAASARTIVKESLMHSKPMQTNDVVMIDLTQDSPKTLTKTTNFPKRTVPTTINSLPVRERLGKLSNPTLPSPKPDSPFVKFGSPLAWKRNRIPRRSPASEFRSEGESKKKDIGSISHEDHKNSRMYTPDYRSYDNHSFRDTKSGEDPIPRIVDVISELTEVIIQNTSRRFDNVRNDLRTGRDSILVGTADDLTKMHSTSIEHFNSLVDIEEEYADYRRNVIDGLGDLSKTTQEICHYLAETIQDSNRNSLSRNFSNAFFTLPLPAIISNPKLVL